MCCGKGTITTGIRYPSPVKEMTYQERLEYLANTKEFKAYEEKGYEIKVSKA